MAKPQAPPKEVQLLPRIVIPTQYQLTEGYPVTEQFRSPKLFFGGFLDVKKNWLTA